MSGRNLAKPFAIAGFILGEIYMLFAVLGDYGRETQPPPVPIPVVDTVQRARRRRWVQRCRVC